MNPMTLYLILAPLQTGTFCPPGHFVLHAARYFPHGVAVFPHDNDIPPSLNIPHILTLSRRRRPIKWETLLTRSPHKNVSTPLWRTFLWLQVAQYVDSSLFSSSLPGLCHFSSDIRLCMFCYHS
jgi:hypothetical protein